MWTGLSAVENGRIAPTTGTTTENHVTPRSGVMDDQLNVPLEDVELLAEVELTTDLIIAASETDRALPQAAIDELLGVDEVAKPSPLDHFPTQAQHGA
jgi:hypothetical protein